MYVKSIGSLVVEGFWPQSMQVLIKNHRGGKLGYRNRELKQVINMASVSARRIVQFADLL